MPSPAGVSVKSSASDIVPFHSMMLIFWQVHKACILLPSLGFHKALPMFHVEDLSYLVTWCEVDSRLYIQWTPDYIYTTTVQAFTTNNLFSLVCVALQVAEQFAMTWRCCTLFLEGLSTLQLGMCFPKQIDRCVQYSWGQHGQKPVQTPGYVLG